MSRKTILHMLTPLRQMSPFDVNMALDAGYDHVVPYTDVTLADVTGLVVTEVGIGTIYLVAGYASLLLLERASRRYATLERA